MTPSNPGLGFRTGQVHLRPVYMPAGQARSTSRQTVSRTIRSTAWPLLRRVGSICFSSRDLRCNPSHAVNPIPSRENLSKHVSPRLAQTSSCREGREPSVPVFPDQYPLNTSGFGGWQCMFQFGATLHFEHFLLFCRDHVQTLPQFMPSSKCAWEVESMRRKLRSSKGKCQKIKIGLPDLEHVKSAVLTYEN